MKLRTKAGKVWLALATTLLVTTGASSSWAINSAGETGCFAAMMKSTGKHSSAVAKAMAACETRLIAGETASCPDATAQAAIDKSDAKTVKSLLKKCQSTCSLSGVGCIGTQFCPPLDDVFEECTAAGKKYMEATNMGFPGPYCPAIIDARMIDSSGFGICAAGLGEIAGNTIIENIYGSVNSMSSLTDGAKDCLAALAKTTPKAVATMANNIAKCRNTQLSSASPVMLPENCPTNDPVVVEKNAAAKQKVLDAIDNSCGTPSDVLLLDLCGSGVGNTANAAAAKACIGAMIDELVFAETDPEDRVYAQISFVNAVYPDTAAARCGDNLKNQIANQFLLNGEECDGTDDEDCPGACLPPGDLFECTCSTVKRARVFADGFNADLDNGWNGSSHNNKTPDGAGFVGEVSNCNCSSFTGADCTGTTSDSVCDVTASVQPRCTHRLDDGSSCDSAGNQDGTHLDSDCGACDAFAENEGAYCSGDLRRCIGGANTGDFCNQNSECPGGTCTGFGQCASGVLAGGGCINNTQCSLCTGGTRNGLFCANNGQCPGGTCSAPVNCLTDTCFGGANDGNACSANGQCPGGECRSMSDCKSQCYAATDSEGATPLGACTRQADCGEGEICRGTCDNSNTCLKLRTSAPLPLSAEGTSVCLDSQFFSNIVGTRDIVDGSHALNYELRSVTYLANDVNSRPCPVCGGWCAETGGGVLDRFRCNGTCSGPTLECRAGPNIGNACLTNGDCDGQVCGGVACRFDDDCGLGETCTGTDSPECRIYCDANNDCPTGVCLPEGFCDAGDCRIDLACAGGPNQGLACRIEAETAFGTTSADCPPDVGSNLSGNGLAISWTPITSGTVSQDPPTACDASGYENYDCNCMTTPPYQTGDSTRTQPNACRAACNAGPSYGVTCANFTKCVGGAENGAFCDSNSDCSGGGTCTDNPKVCGAGNLGECSVKHCSITATNAGDVCKFNEACPGGTCEATSCTVGGAPCDDGYCVGDTCTVDASPCADGGVCGDVCPGGLCTPLCIERGVCNGGDRDGFFCALDYDCTGGGVCDPDDPDEGACVNGAYNHCSGPGWEFLGCSASYVGTKLGCESGTDEVVGNANDFAGAGFCIADVKNCFVGDGEATGGGTPTLPFSVASFCIPPTTSSAVNASAGLPGPGRIRQPSEVVPNFTSLP